MVKQKFRISNFEFRIVAFSFIIYLVLVFCGNINNPLFAQDVQATARVDSNNITIGDWLLLHLEVQHPENVSVDWYSLPDSLEGFEVLKREAPSAQKNNQLVTESLLWRITAFDSGTFVIPSLQIRYSVAGDSSRRFAVTSPIPVFVHGVAVDTTQEIKDVKPPLTVPISFAEILPYLLVVLGIGGLIWLIYYIRKKRKKGEPLIPEAPPRPAHEIALDALRSLEAEHIWQRGKVKEYYSQLTDIVRLYIENRFKVLALESTTDEILDFAPMQSLGKDVKGNLKEVLVRADLVKFAKFQPQTAEHDSSLALSRSFVESTWQTNMVSQSNNVVKELKS